MSVPQYIYQWIDMILSKINGTAKDREQLGAAFVRRFPPDTDHQNDELQQWMFDVQNVLSKQNANIPPPTPLNHNDEMPKLVNNQHSNGPSLGLCDTVAFESMLHGVHNSLEIFIKNNKLNNVSSPYHLHINIPFIYHQHVETQNVDYQNVENAQIENVYISKEAAEKFERVKVVCCHNGHLIKGKKKQRVSKGFYVVNKKHKLDVSKLHKHSLSREHIHVDNEVKSNNDNDEEMKNNSKAKVKNPYDFQCLDCLLNGKDKTSIYKYKEEMPIDPLYRIHLVTNHVVIEEIINENNCESDDDIRERKYHHRPQNHLNFDNV